MNNSSQNGSEGSSADSSAAVKPCDLHIEERDKFDLGRDVYVATTDETSKLAYELPSVKREGSSGFMKLDCEFNVPGTDLFPAKVIQDDSMEPEPPPENQIDMLGIESEHIKEVCEDKKFICDASDLFNSSSPTKEISYEKQQQKILDSGTLSFIAEVLQPPNENIDESPTAETPLKSSENQGGAGELNVTNQVPEVRARSVLAEEVVHCVKTDLDDKSSTQQQQTTIRHCLVNEMSGSLYRKLLSNPAGCPPLCKSSASPKTSKEKSLDANKLGSSKFSSLIPGIGLHLNALAATGRDKIIVKRQKLTCRRHLISSPCTMSSFNSDIELLNPPLVSEVVGRACEVQKIDAQLNENACENSTFGDGIGFPQSFLNNKRKNPESVGETDSCKHCNCKRSKCLKLYCECFAAGIYCVQSCNCQDCFNKPSHEDTVLETRRQIESRNPLAFAPKVILCTGSSSTGNALNKIPASARYKRGCNCKKSGCLKKYCECFQGGVGCSPSCRCEGCKNTFGQKGIEGIVFEEAKILKECASDVSLHGKFTKTDHENKAPCEHSNNTRSESSFTSPWTIPSIMHKSAD